MDLEMTGLNPDTDQILEIATVITTNNLDIVAEGPNIAIHYPEDVLAGMDEWCQRHHSASGLIDRVLHSDISLAQAETETLEFIRAYVPEGKSPLCGNSIYQDRRFLYRHMPTLESYLHYRIIDVSTIKEVVHRWYEDVQLPPKEETHLARKDIHESIEELRFYRQRYFR
jgi:oligoribonuclease